MAGIGEKLSPAPPMPDFWMVLANPGVGVTTGTVFSAVTQCDNPPAPSMPPLTDFAALIDWLAQQRNDLQSAAISACPVIAEVLAALSEAPLARMSGSGATCFALHADEADAATQADRLRCAHPDWWVIVAAVEPIPRTLSGAPTSWA